VWRYDGAEPWQPSSTGLPTGGSGEGFSGVTALLWDVSAVPQPQGLYAGTADAGLYRRARDQDPWSEANAMLTSVSGAYGAVAALAQKRQGGGLLLGFGAEPGSGFLGGLWQSDDRGATWSPAGAGLPRAALTALALGGPDGSSVLAGTDGAGLAVSADGGAGFQAAGPFTALAPGLGAIAVDPQDPNRVWVASRQGGVYRSLDGGLRFEPFNAGLSSADVLALAFATSAGPSAPAVLYAGTADGLFRSPDGASPWEAAGSGLPPGPVAAVLVSGGGPGPAAGTVWAAVQGAGLHVQPNGAPGFGPAGLTQPVATLLRERSSGLVWAGTDGAGVYESLDGLGTWFEVNSGLPATALSIGDLELAAPADGRGTRQPQDVIWLGARGGGGVRRYRPGVRGTLVWEDTGLAAGLDVRALQYVADTDSLYAGTDQGVWRLRPAATAVGAWSLVDGIPPDPAAQSIQDLALVPPGPGALAGLLASTDAGLFRIEISFTRSAVAGLLPGLTVLAGALAALIQGAARLARSRSRKRR
jgi:ligand-binding sensor domain-containing protein